MENYITKPLVSERFFTIFKLLRYPLEYPREEMTASRGRVCYDVNGAFLDFDEDDDEVEVLEDGRPVFKNNLLTKEQFSAVIEIFTKHLPTIDFPQYFKDFIYRKDVYLEMEPELRAITEGFEQYCQARNFINFLFNGLNPVY